jgi:hypothetical protein
MMTTYPSETQSHPAYKCGRLLAVIERIQAVLRSHNLL